MQLVETHITNSKEIEAICIKSNTTFIYGLFCPIKKQIRYIGKSNNPKKRFYRHLYDAKLNTHTHKNAWIISLLKLKLTPELIILEETNITQWQQREIYYINKYKNLLNISLGGEGAGIMSDITKEKLRIANTGKKLSEETKLKIKNSNTGKIVSQERKDNIKKAWDSGIRKITSNDLKRIDNLHKTNIGKKRNEEFILKRKEKSKGEGNPMFSKKQSEFNKMQCSLKNSKKIIQFSLDGEYIKKWDSAILAAITLNINKGSICNNLKNRAKTGGGYIWKYTI